MALHRTIRVYDRRGTSQAVGATLFAKGSPTTDPGMKMHVRIESSRSWSIASSERLIGDRVDERTFRIGVRLPIETETRRQGPLEFAVFGRDIRVRDQVVPKRYRANPVRAPNRH